MVFKDVFLKFFLMLGLLGSFVNPFHILSNALLIKGLGLRTSIAPIIFLISIMCLLFVKINFFGVFTVVNSIRYYFGFLLFILVFASLSSKTLSQTNISNFIFKIFAFSTIIEFVYINFIGDASHLHFLRCGRDCSDWEYKTFFGFYRAFGIGASPSISSGLLVVAFIRSNFKNKWPIFLIALGMHMSGFGVAAFVILLLVRYPILGMVFFALLLPISLNIEDSDSKIGWLYINMLVWYKYSSWIIMWTAEDFNYFVGNLSKLVAGGDFGYLGLTNDFGLLGLLSFVLATSLLGRGLFVEKIIILLSGFHYNLLFAVPGQILFAWIVFQSQNFKKKK